ncbi:actin-related protein Arp4p [Multifurca ochricompacta]|uniref:Actin-related protein Arp4p n=1 Tax=Multifurca ochricompacta TaxID=376703 RepID=A0AAD4M717_9AGAM|nr:actin-related protein Arp4p [Multifurca ochricompacta]
MVQYGGDEVSALVVDIGSSTLRAGYAGDDSPKAIIPTSYGFVPLSRDSDVSMAEAGTEPETASPKEESKLYIGQHGPSVWREDMQIGNPMNEGLITDFKPIPSLIRHALKDVLHCKPEDHPILVTEPAWNTSLNRERMAEIMFEEFQVPAFYIANTGVLNAFAAGKGSALVIDIGHSTSSVTPVVDGFVLRKGLVHSALPQLVHAHAKHTLITASHNHPPIQLFSHQLIANKTPVEPGTPPRFTLRDDRFSKTTPSLASYYENREVEEWVQSVAGVLDQGWNDQAASQRPARHYEFPTGFNTYFGPERFQVGELFFAHSRDLVASNPHLPRTVPALISQALAACDPDMRQVLMGNVVLAGGGSLFAGLGERLNNELVRNFPHVKIHAPGNPTERRYGGWLGGSILASLGTFHQLWISKEEWQEHGKPIVAQRCK